MSTDKERSSNVKRGSESSHQWKQQPRYLRNASAIAKAVMFAMALLLTAPVIAQQTTGNARASGDCSPAVTGNGNTFYFTYCGNDPEERARVFKILTALSQGEDLTNSKLDQILALLGAPPKIYEVRKEQEKPVERGKPPRASITFYTVDPISRGQFEIVCDRPCRPVDICRLMGANQSILATVSGVDNLADFIFRRDFPNLTQCKLTVESRDLSPVNIVSISVSRRLDNLVLNHEQPSAGVSAGGAWMQ